MPAQYPWADFVAASASDDIVQFAEHPKLIGLRPIIPDIGDYDWMLYSDLAPVFEQMIKGALIFKVSGLISFIFYELAHGLFRVKQLSQNITTKGKKYGDQKMYQLIS